MAERTDNNFADVPKQGDVVTFEYEKGLYGIKNVRVSRVRKDCSWEDVVHDFFTDPASPAVPRGILAVHGEKCMREYILENPYD
jgi:hypothetical protein